MRKLLTLWISLILFNSSFAHLRRPAMGGWFLCNGGSFWRGKIKFLIGWFFNQSDYLISVKNDFHLIELFVKCFKQHLIFGIEFGFDHWSLDKISSNCKQLELIFNWWAIIEGCANYWSKTTINIEQTFLKMVKWPHLTNLDEFQFKRLKMKGMNAHSISR